jgi:hypothetical protein
LYGLPQRQQSCVAAPAVDQTESLSGASRLNIRALDAGLRSVQWLTPKASNRGVFQAGQASDSSTARLVMFVYSAREEFFQRLVENEAEREFPDGGRP